MKTFFSFFTRHIVVCCSLIVLFIASLVWMAQPHPTQAVGPTIIPTVTITTNQTWSLDNSPYIVQGWVTVDMTSTLTIEPGVEVRFDSGGIVVKSASSLIAEGTQTQPIIFTSNKATPAPRDWSYLEFQDNAIGRLSYCDISYGETIRISTSDIVVANTRIHHFSPSYYGVVILRNMGITPTFENVTIDNNESTPIYQETVTMNPIYKNITLNNNSLDGVLVASSYDNVDRDTLIDGSGLNNSPIVMARWVTVANSATLTIAPGTEIQFPPLGSALQGNITVQKGSTLIAEGTDSQPIKFTTTQPTPEPAYWSYLRFEDGSHARLAYCDIGYGEVQIYTTGVDIRNTTIHDGHGHGITLNGVGMTATLDAVTISNNQGHAIYQSNVTMNPSYTNITMQGNGTDAVYVATENIDRDVLIDGRGLHGSPFILAGWVTVVNSATLTIAPGTEIQFPPLGSALQGNITVQKGSTLAAEGTPTQPITFTTTQKDPEPAYWSYLRMEEGSHARLAYCDIGYGEVQIYATGIDIRNTTIHDGAGRGIFFNGDTITATLDTVTISHNKGVAIEQSTLDMNPSYTNVTLQENGTDAVGIYRSFPMVGIPINHDVVLNSVGLNGSPYQVYGWVTVSNTSTLTILPGTIIQFGPLGTALQGNITIESGSTLSATGTLSQTILMSAVPTVVYQPGIWSHIMIKPGGYASIEHCTLDYGGSWGTGTLAIQSSDVVVRNATINSSAGTAIVIADGIAPLLENISVNYTVSAAVQQSLGTSATYRNFSLSNNGLNGIYIYGSQLYGDAHWNFSDAGVPAYIQQDVAITDGSFLTIGAGSQIECITDTTITVNGGLYIEGTQTHPVSFTGMVNQPSSWNSITINKGGHATINYADFSYGGKGGEAMLNIYSDNVVVQNSRFHHSGSHSIGVFGDDIRPIIQYNQIISNTVGGLCRAPNSGLCYQDGYPTATLDARYNWWGDTSGPYHPTLNPDGKGAQVSYNVLFQPWLEQFTPYSGTLLIGRMLTEVGGNTLFSPGQTAMYRIGYNNQTTQTITQPVVILDLPANASFVDATDGGIYWDERHQVFWLPDSMPPQNRHMYAVRVRYHWQIPSWVDDVVTGFVAADSLDAGIDTAPYLAYTATTITQQKALSEAEITQERQTYPDVDRYYEQALAEGLVRIGAVETTLSDGTTATELTFAGMKSLKVVRRSGDVVQTSSFNPLDYTMQQPDGGLRYDYSQLSTDEWGDWTAPDNVKAFAGYLSAPQLSASQCFRNCMLRLYANTAMGLISKPLGLALTAPSCVRGLMGDMSSAQDCFLSIQQQVPFAGELKGTMDCFTDCKDPRTRDKWVCEKSITTCDRREYWYNPLSWYGGSKRSYSRRVCNTTIGIWNDTPEFLTCLKGETCVEGYQDEDGRPCKDCITNDQDPDCKRSEVAVAKDPNAKYGPEGDVLPGQTMSYTITYENVGAGNAYGVYVVDTLSEVFDDSTLAIHSGGEYITTTRTIIWDIGELAPKEQPGSTGEISFSVRLKPNLPGGTVVNNHAVVHFPSVPEETPTNEVVNIIRSVVAIPQQVETTYMQPVDIELVGKEVSNAPLTYRVTEQPLYGTLSGEAPNLTYTPYENVSGEDWLRFVVSNGITESQSADVHITIVPSEDDTTPPTIVWTEPSDNGELQGISATPVYTDELGLAYAPTLLIQFSERIDTTTATSATIQMVDSGQQSIANTIVPNDSSGQIAIIPREALDSEIRYTITLSGVTDLVGNPMEQSYRFSFGSTGNTSIYLPIVMR